MYEIYWAQDAVDELFNLSFQDRRAAARVLTVVRSYGRDGTGDLRKLQGRSHEWRLRTGDWRVRLARDGHRAYVVSVDNRRDAY